MTACNLSPSLLYHLPPLVSMLGPEWHRAERDFSSPGNKESPVPFSAKRYFAIFPFMLAFDVNPQETLFSVPDPFLRFCSQTAFPCFFHARKAYSFPLNQYCFI